MRVPRPRPQSGVICDPISQPAPAGDPSKFEVTGELTATKTANAAVKEVLEGIDEEFVKKVKKCETPEEIRELGVPMGFVAGKPDKQWPDRPGDWLVWMVSSS